MKHLTGFLSFIFNVFLVIYSRILLHLNNYVGFFRVKSVKCRDNSNCNLTFLISFLQAEVLQNVYTDCTRLDEALKKVEAFHSENTKKGDVNTAQQLSEYNKNENNQTSEAYWNCSDYYSGYSSYDYGQAWDHSHHNHQTEAGYSTKDPYREVIASKEAESDSSSAGYDSASMKVSTSEAIPSID